MSKRAHVTPVLQELKHGFVRRRPKMCLRLGFGTGVKHDYATWLSKLCFNS